MPLVQHRASSSPPSPPAPRRSETLSPTSLTAGPCDKKWFVNTFCDGHDPTPPLGFDSTFAAVDDSMVWGATTHFPVYSAQLLIAALPQTRTALLEAEFHYVHGIGHMIIGKSKDRPGVKRTKAGSLDDQSLCMRHFLCQIVAKGVRMNHSEFDELARNLTQEPCWYERGWTWHASTISECDGMSLTLSDEPFPASMVQSNPTQLSQHLMSDGTPKGTPYSTPVSNQRTLGGS